MARISLSPFISNISGKLSGAIFQNSQSGLTLRGFSKKTTPISEFNTITENNAFFVKQEWRKLSDKNKTIWSNFVKYLNETQKHNKNRIINGEQCFFKFNTYRLLYNYSVLIIPQFIKCELLPYTATLELSGGALLFKTNRTFDTSFEYCILQLSFRQSKGVFNSNVIYRTIKFVTTGANSVDISTEYIKAFGELPVANDIIFMKYTIADKRNGRLLSFTTTRFEVVGSSIQSYFDKVTAVGGTLTDAEKSKIKAFAISLKSTGEWNKMHAVYPMRGDGKEAMSINLIAPETFTLDFVNTVPADFTSQGWQGNRVNLAYAKSGYIPSVVSDVNSFCGMYYSASDDSFGSLEFGAYNSSSQSMYMHLNWDSYRGSCWNESSGKGFVVGGVFPSDFFGLMSRISDSDFRLFKDGVQVGSTATGAPIGSLPDIEIYINCWNYNGRPQYHSNKLCQILGFGNGLTQAEVTNINSYVQTLNSDR